MSIVVDPFNIATNGMLSNDPLCIATGGIIFYLEVTPWPTPSVTPTVTPTYVVTVTPTPSGPATTPTPAPTETIPTVLPSNVGFGGRNAWVNLTKAGKKKIKVTCTVDGITYTKEVTTTKVITTVKDIQIKFEKTPKPSISVKIKSKIRPS